jgi:hypothetical protein
MEFADAPDQRCAFGHAGGTRPRAMSVTRRRYLRIKLIVRYSRVTLDGFTGGWIDHCIVAHAVPCSYVRFDSKPWRVVVEHVLNKFNLNPIPGPGDQLFAGIVNNGVVRWRKLRVTRSRQWARLDQFDMGVTSFHFDLTTTYDDN